MACGVTGKWVGKKLPNHILVGSAYRNSDSAVLQPVTRKTFWQCFLSLLEISTHAAIETFMKALLESVSLKVNL
jgi:hypothetical protein